MPFWATVAGKALTSVQKTGGAGKAVGASRRQSKAWQQEAPQRTACRDSVGKERRCRQCPWICSIIVFLLSKANQEQDASEMHVKGIGHASSVVMALFLAALKSQGYSLVRISADRATRTG